jgi:tetratricopeptide (TPR) repeat protein
MSSNSLNASISQAWRYQREHQAATAITEYEKILKQDANNIDALYGYGLSLRDTGKKAEATAQFKRALELVDAAALSRRPATTGEEEHRTVNTPEDDRYMMLSRMIKQRLSEIEAGK